MLLVVSLRGWHLQLGTFAGDVKLITGFLFGPRGEALCQSASGQLTQDCLLGLLKRA